MFRAGAGETCSNDHMKINIEQNEEWELRQREKMCGNSQNEKKEKTTKTKTKLSFLLGAMHSRE